MNNYKVTKSIEEQDVWFKECKKRQIYYVFITPRAKYSKINWDHISLNLSLEEEIDIIHNPVEEKMQGIIDIFMRHFSNKNGYVFKANYNGSSLVGEFDNIPNDIAPQLAEDLANYLNNLLKNYIK